MHIVICLEACYSWRMFVFDYIIFSNKHSLLNFIIMTNHIFTNCTGFNVTDIRLSDGGVLYKGRVEVKISGLWGTVCGYGFDYNDITVICRMLGFR